MTFGGSSVISNPWTTINTVQISIWMGLLHIVIWSRSFCGVGSRCLWSEKLELLVWGLERGGVGRGVGVGCWFGDWELGIGFGKTDNGGGC